MVRQLFAGILLAAVLFAQDDPQLKKRPTGEAKPQQQQDQEPPEEDDSLAPKTYSFNPLEAEKDVKIGLYYFKKGNYKASSSRFREATLWNPTYADAFLHLGESAEKMKDKKAAEEAYTKYLALAPDGKEAQAVKKKLARQR